MFSVVVFVFLVVVVTEVALTVLAGADTVSYRHASDEDRDTTTGQPLRPILASDEEREATAKRIGAAMGDGRLGLEEGIERIEAAVGARYRRELVELRSDLPPSSWAKERAHGRW